MTAPNVSKTHLGLELSDGTTITLPMSAWLDQTFARLMLAKATGDDLPPPLSDAAWIDLVYDLYAAAEEA